MFCEKLNSTHQESTCIARMTAITTQQARHKERNKCKGNGPAWGHGGGVGAVLKYVSCIGCEIGLKLLSEEKNMSDQKEKQEAIEEIKMKRCSRKTCLKEYPATSEFFTANNNSADKLSYYCKPCQAQIAKDKYYNKKSTVRDLKPKEIETQTSPIETPPLSE